MLGWMNKIKGNACLLAYSFSLELLERGQEKNRCLKTNPSTTYCYGLLDTGQVRHMRTTPAWHVREPSPSPFFCIFNLLFSDFDRVFWPILWRFFRSQNLQIGRNHSLVITDREIVQLELPQILRSSYWIRGAIWPINKTPVQKLKHTILYTFFSSSKAIISLNSLHSLFYAFIYFHGRPVFIWAET